MITLLALALGIVAALVCGVLYSRTMTFRAQSIDDFRGQSPQFDLRHHLNGPILCEGVIYGPTGRVVSRFVADMDAQWDGNTGTMTEHFRYDSGATQDRRWTLTLGNDGSIRAEAPDVMGQGHGRVNGPAVRLAYKLRLARDAGGHVLKVTDWMYLMENGTILNRSQFTKFGVKVAELVATMRKVPA
jgi:hypothetical protein